MKKIRQQCTSRLTQEEKNEAKKFGIPTLFRSPKKARAKITYAQEFAKALERSLKRKREGKNADEKAKGTEHNIAIPYYSDNTILALQAKAAKGKKR